MNRESFVSNNVELLAPAGSYEGFLAALCAGADAVYAGGQMFGARAFADNFTNEQLIDAISIAHLYDRKVYLTVNTLIKNHEMKTQLYNYLAPFYEAGLDAVLVQDFGVVSFIRREFPDLPIHASTQMTVTGPESMKYLEQLGLTRIVPARELSLKEIKELHNSSPLEIESFIHGALCYSFSGQCFMSSMYGGRSGNRGRCAQPCRLAYDTALQDLKYQNKKEFCPLSMKDSCTIDLLPEIVDAGVVSLKIEGRMKQPSYAAGVTAIYRKYLDLLSQKGAKHYKVDPKDRDELLNLFSRGGSCTGYYEVHNGSQMIDFQNDKKRGQTASYELFGSFGTGRKLPGLKVNGVLSLMIDYPASLTVYYGDLCVTVNGDVVQKASNRPMEESRIRSQMEKLGDTQFEWDVLDIVMDDAVFMPVKSINELRRAAFSELLQLILEPLQRKCIGEITKEDAAKPQIANEIGRLAPAVYASCETRKTAEVLLANDRIDGIYVPYDILCQMEEKLFSSEKEIFLMTPYIVREGFSEQIISNLNKWVNNGLKGILVRSLETFSILKKMGLSSYIILDHQMYTWNDEAISFWAKEGILRTTIPVELNEKELLHRDNSHSEMIVYGYQPLMISAQCVRKNVYGCTQANEHVYLKDRKGKEMYVQCVCNPWKDKNTANPLHCYNIIYNSIPFGLLSEAERVLSLKPAAVRLSFTIETEKQVKELVKDFTDAYRTRKSAKDYDFTKGHFKRGVE
ncbi:MAG: DUF3656 domain-containing protein [Eubacteriales bacterium]|nr:DUF3656 domain-containing protein [Eubacteriales bacterium]